MTTTDSDWSWTSLRGADLSGLVLTGQRFREADLTGADLRGASTDGVDWRAFGLTGVRLHLVQAVQVARAQGAPVVD